MTVSDLVPPMIRDSGLGNSLRRLVAPALVVLGLVVLAGLAAGAAYMSRNAEIDRLDRQLTALTAEVGTTGQQLDNATERMLELTTENTELKIQTSDQATQISDMTDRLATLEQLTQSSTNLEQSLATLTQQYSALQDQKRGVEDQLALLQAEWDPVKPIETIGPVGNPLLINTSLDAWVTEALCTGSMEPAITCDDVMVLYPPSFTDLGVGDIIVFRRQNPTCTGYVEGGLIVHRIIKVTSTAGQGLAFQTQGDANPYPDPCTVPVTDVTAKVLGVIYDAKAPQ